MAARSNKSKAGRKIGAHVAPANSIGDGVDRGADLVQTFLGNPQSWSAPVCTYPGGIEGLRDAAKEAGIDLYIHAAYLINVASTNNRVRIPSRKSLQATVSMAAEVGAKGVVVHGGSVPEGDDVAAGYANWRKCVDQLDQAVPVFIENTAGGTQTMTRTLESIARLWDEVGHSGVGFCLDTCHAFAAGLELPDAVDALRAITGRIDLVHANDSKGAAGSGLDRHDNLGNGQIDPDVFVATVKAANAPIVCETPNGLEGQAADIAWLRERLAA